MGCEAGVVGTAVRIFILPRSCRNLPLNCRRLPRLRQDRCEDILWCYLGCDVEDVSGVGV